MCMIEDELCNKCGLDITDGFEMSIKGFNYCPECWYYVMSNLRVIDGAQGLVDTYEDQMEYSRFNAW